MVSGVDLKVVLDSIDSTLKVFVIDNNLDVILATLCSMVVLFQFTKVVIKNLIRGGESFSFDMIGVPFFSILMILAWPEISSFVLDASNGIAEGVVAKQEKLSNFNKDGYVKIDDFIYKIEEKHKAIDESIVDSNSGFDFGFETITNEIKLIKETMALKMAKMMLDFISYIDAFIYICFYFIAKLWLKFVLFGGSIAFTISLLTGGWTNLINWAKTVVNVALWLPVASLMINLINAIMSTVFESVLNSLNDIPTDLEVAMSAVSLYGNVTKVVLELMALTVIFIGLKLIMLSKVPAIIGTWISGGGGANGGMSMGFVPIALAGAAAKTAASSVTSSISSGINSFKK